MRTQVETTTTIEEETEEKEVAAYSSGYDPRDRWDPENEIVEQQPQQPPTEVSIILSDSIVQRVHEPRKKVGHRVVVKPFPGSCV